ncbi:hypothetical protein ACFXK0_24430 [Nocardia sp. NPDC059177]|uniref:hypothetical protein n=1 Tax=Nocardia sp. NPDC059177 TaxID=3346759 RepID=UPI0036CBA530
MPFAANDIVYHLMRVQRADGRTGCVVGIAVRADALRPLGLHPDQPSSRPVGPSPPGWWHAAGERSVWAQW